MLIVPADSRFSQGRLPWVTLLLVLINTYVLFGIQGDDDEYRKQAFTYYFKDGLSRIELPHYLQELRAHGKGAQADQLQALADAQDQARNKDADKDEDKELSEGEAKLITALLADRDFHERMSSGDLVRPADPEYATWKPLRQHYDELSAHVIGERYAFNPAHPSVVTVFTHMFLHGGIGHLLGNMVMLLLVGAMVEYALGPLLYPLLYLAGGLCAVSAYWLVHLGAFAPMLGASGAIASVMGMFAVLYGARKVRFFYSLVVYFDFIALPAIVLLPYWLGWEVLQFFLDRGAHIAYEAHAGGLAGGAALAYASRRRGSEEARESLDRPDQDAQWDASLQQAMALMAKLDFARARQVFEQLYAERPNDLRPLLQLYRIAKASPASDDYHRHAQTLLAMRGPNQDALFDEYWQHAKPQPRLAQQQLMQMLNRYAAAVDVPRVDRVLGALLRQGSREPGIGQVLAALAARVPEDKARAYRALAARHFA